MVQVDGAASHIEEEEGGDEHATPAADKGGLPTPSRPNTVNNDWGVGHVLSGTSNRGR